MNLTVLDYGAGNLKSVTNMITSLGYSFNIARDKEAVLNADKLIFPGVGHFGQVMAALDSRDLTQTLRHKILSGTSFLGICLGLQVLFEESEEALGIKGLGVFKGKVVKFTDGKIPQIGWNKLITTSNNSVLTDDYVYFVNSYYVLPQNDSIISAYAEYHNKFVASVECKNTFGMQFHPEKSGQVGYDILQKWINL